MAKLSPTTAAFMISPYIIICCIFFVVANIPWLHTAAASTHKNQLCRCTNDSNSITVASKDYGNIVHQNPSLVFNPCSDQDIVDLMIRSSANNNHTTIAARGHGHSTRGQAMALGGIVVNMTSLGMGGNRIVIGRDYADVGGEQLWIDVLRATLQRGLAPVSWTDYLYLTVGGTMSNAGISGQAFLHGPQISNVLQLDVVTGRGKHITCSANTNTELFHGVLGGLGQFGIITRARIVLKKAPTRVKWARLIYSDFMTFTRDQELLISGNDGSVSYVEGLIIVNQSTIYDQWRPLFRVSTSDQTRISKLLSSQTILYTIEVAMYYDDHNTTGDVEFQKLLKGLKFIPGLKFGTDVSLFDFLNRLGNLDTPNKGSLQSHPWLNFFLPKSHIVDLNKRVLAGMLPRLKNAPGTFLFYPMNKNKWNDAMSAVTVDGDVFYVLGLLHSSPAGEYKSFDDFNNEVLSVCKEAGINVKEYLPIYKNMSAWKIHFGSKWKTFLDRKTKFDPKMMLSPGQAIFN